MRRLRICNVVNSLWSRKLAVSTPSRWLFELSSVAITENGCACFAKTFPPADSRRSRWPSYYFAVPKRSNAAATAR